MPQNRKRFFIHTKAPQDVQPPVTNCSHRSTVNMSRIARELKQHNHCHKIDAARSYDMSSGPRKLHRSRVMNVWTRIELAVKSTSRHSPLAWVAHTRTLTRTPPHWQAPGERSRTHARWWFIRVRPGGSANMHHVFNAAARKWRLTAVGSWGSVCFTKWPVMEERARAYCRSHERLAECVRMHRRETHSQTSSVLAHGYHTYLDIY